MFDTDKPKGKNKNTATKQQQHTAASTNNRLLKPQKDPKPTGTAGKRSNEAVATSTTVPLKKRRGKLNND